MNVSGHTVLITGGAGGIGHALATRFHDAGSDVMICGRRADKLREARAAHPSFKIKTCDIADARQRLELLDWAFAESPELDVLVNNAGVQQWLDLHEPIGVETIQREIATNVEAHIHLALAFFERVKTKQGAAIVNVTSGLAFVPLARVPIYCATKAAMHSFTRSLRHQLADTPVEVVEVIPPAVNTDLGGPGLHTWATPLDEFADAAFAQLKSGKDTVTYGLSAEAIAATPEQLDAIFARMNAH